MSISPDLEAFPTYSVNNHDWCNGAGDQGRTGDLHLGKVAHYHCATPALLELRKYKQTKKICQLFFSYNTLSLSYI